MKHCIFDLDHMMKGCSFAIMLLVMYGNACCKETEYEGYKHDEASNLTTEDDNRGLLTDLMRPRRFTSGTLLGLLVASVVVVIGSFLVLWRLCCDVEMIVTREVMEPLNSISKKVANSPKTSAKRSASKERLLDHSCTSSVFEIA